MCTSKATFVVTYGQDEAYLFDGRGRRKSDKHVAGDYEQHVYCLFM